SASKTLRSSIDDLHETEELQELGMAVFLDRPLAGGKAPGEPDRTLLFSHEAFSRSIAEWRLQHIAETLGLLAEPVYKTLREYLQSLPAPSGIAIPTAPCTERPGAVSLSDAANVADDFKLLKTTRQTLQQFLDQFNWGLLAGRLNLDFLESKQPLLIVPEASDPTGADPVLRVYDSAFRARLELRADLTLGYEMRAGNEYPRAGLQVVRAWQNDGVVQELDLRVLPQ